MSDGNSATDIVRRAIMSASHPLREAIERVLESPPSVPLLGLDRGQVSAIATDILQALEECNLGDVPSEYLKRRVAALEAENNGLVLAVARLSGGVSV